MQFRGILIATVTSFTATADTGITIANSIISGVNKVVVRLSGGTLGSKYNVTVSATAPNGEVRDMTVIFLIV